MGDTLIRMTKDAGNLTDYTVLIQDVAKDTEVSVTFPHFTDAHQAFGLAYSQAKGEEDDLKALMNVE
jgi:hypothetical protein